MIMDKLIADGRVRILDDKRAYILKYVDEASPETLDSAEGEFYRILLEYIYETDKDLTLTFLFDASEAAKKLLELEIIFKPADDPLMINKPTFGFKFNRTKNDKGYFAKREYKGIEGL